MRKLIVLFLLTLFLLSCTNRSEDTYKPDIGKTDPRKPRAWGHKQTIYVFADDNVWKYAKQHLEDSLERYVFTNRNEKYFTLQRAPYEKIEQFHKFNNLIFFCDMQSNKPVSVFVKDKMGSQVEKDIQENSVGMYPIENLWANDQYVLFLVGNNEENLLKFNILQSNKIFELFQEKLYDRIARQIYNSKVYPESEFREFPWHLKIPINYVLYKKDLQNNFISYLGRSLNRSDRYVSVYYEKMPADSLNRKWIRKKRAELAWEYYDEDKFSKDTTQMSLYKLGNHKGWKLWGRWQNEKHMVGGAFQTFAFYHEPSKTAYLIDNSVYYPEGEKLKELIELEVISRTIKIKNNN
ncbi:MAG: DUF4837 family protein [Candidatus Cloacimonadota bacterium]|nr:DUF4837 family protein [Candidatus Cloacimonadota bacterium]